MPPNERRGLMRKGKPRRAASLSSGTVRGVRTPQRMKSKAANHLSSAREICCKEGTGATCTKGDKEIAIAGEEDRPAEFRRP